MKGEFWRIPAIFICDHLQIKENVQFLVDTGAARTQLSESTAKALGIDISRDPQGKIGGLGGLGDRYVVGNVRLVFTTTDSSELEEKLQSVDIMKNPPPRDRRERELFESIPNLLGLDVIRRFKILRIEEDQKGRMTCLYLER